MRRLLPFALACVLLPAFPSTAQTSADEVRAPFERLRSRLGADVDRDEQRYFGLFPATGDAFRSATVAPLADGGLAFSLRLERAGVAIDSSLTLPAEQAAALATYVEQYEEIFVRGPERQAALLSGLLRRRIARPGAFPEGRLAEGGLPRRRLVLRGGERVEGGLLYASGATYALWTGSGTYDWRRVATEVRLIAASDVEAVVVPGASEAVRVGEVLLPALTLAATAAPGAFGFDDGTAAVVTGGVTAVAVALVRLGPAARRNPRASTFVPRAGYFQRGLPPELAARLALGGEGDVAGSGAGTAARPARRAERRAWVHVTVGTTQATGSARANPIVTTATATGATLPRSFPPVREEGRVQTRASAIHADAQFDVRRWLFVGGEGTWHRDPERPARYGEAVTGRRVVGAFAGVRVGGRGRPFYGNAVAVGGGMRRLDARVRGALYSTLALGQGEPGPEEEAELVTAYADRAAAWQPFVRLAYEYVLSDFSAVFVKGTFGPPLKLDQKTHVARQTYLGNTFEAERPAHPIRLGARYAVVGMRLRL